MKEVTLKVDESMFDCDTFGAPYDFLVDNQKAESLTEIDLTKVQLKLFDHSQSVIEIQQWLDKVEEGGGLPLSSATMQTFWKNQHLIPEEWKCLSNGNITFIEFAGTIFQDEDGDCSVLSLFWDNNEWAWCYKSLDGSKSEEKNTFCPVLMS